MAFCLLCGPALTTVHDHCKDHSLHYTDLCWQSNVSTFQHTVLVSLFFSPAKKQSSSDFMASVTICSYFGAQEEEICHYFHLFPFYLPCSSGARCHNLSFFNMASIGRKAMANLDSILKKQRHYFANKSKLKLWLFHLSCMDVRVGP